MIGPFRFLGAKSTPCIKCTEIMGTVLYQEIYGLNGIQIAEKVQQNLIRLENLWSPYKTDNVVSQIN